jgi:hypothetical protein
MPTNLPTKKTIRDGMQEVRFTLRELERALKSGDLNEIAYHAGDVRETALTAYNQADAYVTQRQELVRRQSLSPQP